MLEIRGDKIAVGRTYADFKAWPGLDAVLQAQLWGRIRKPASLHDDSGCGATAKFTAKTAGSRLRRQVGSIRGRRQHAVGLMAAVDEEPRQPRLWFSIGDLQ